MDAATQAANAKDTAAQDPKPAQTAAEGTGLQQLQHLLKQGTPTAAAVAQLVLANPNEHDQIFALLQQTLGNAFVQQVIAAATPAAAAATPAPTTKPPATAGPTPAPTTKPPAAAGPAPTATGGTGKPAPAPVPAPPDGVSVDAAGNVVVADADGSLTTGVSGTLETGVNASTKLVTKDGLSGSATGSLSQGKDTSGKTLQAVGKGELDFKDADNTLTSNVTANTGTHTFTGAVSEKVTGGPLAGLNADASVSSVGSVVGGKGDVGFTGKDASVTADVSGDAGKGTIGGGVNGKILTGDLAGLSGGVELVDTAATAPSTTTVNGKKKTTAGTPEDLAVNSTAAFAGKDVTVTGTGTADAVKDQFGGGLSAKVTDGDLKGLSGGINVTSTAGDIATTANAGFTNKDVAVSGTGTADVGKDTFGAGLNAKLTGGALNGLSGNASVTDTAGVLSGKGGLGFTGKDGSINGSVTADAGKDTVTGALSGSLTGGPLAGLSGDLSVTDTKGDISGKADATFAGKDGSITGTVNGDASKDTVGAGVSGKLTGGKLAGLGGDASISDTAGALSGKADVTFDNSKGLTAQGGVTAGPTGVNATGAVDLKGKTKSGVNFETGADASIGTGGISAEAFVAANKTLANGNQVSGAALAGVDNLAPIAGVGAGFENKDKSFGVTGVAAAEADGLALGAQVQVKNVTVTVVTKDLQLVELNVKIAGNHPILNTALAIGGDVVVAALDPIGFGIEEIEKIASRGKPAGIDKLFALVGPGAHGTVTDDASGKSDTTARLTLQSGAVAILTPDDVTALRKMDLIKGNKIDGTVAPELMVERLEHDSQLTDEQKAAIITALADSQTGMKHESAPDVTGVSQVAQLIQNGERNVQKYADLIAAPTHARDNEGPMLSEISVNLGFAFAQKVATRAGFIDPLVELPDHTVAFKGDLPAAQVPAPATPAAKPGDAPAAPTKHHWWDFLK